MLPSNTKTENYYGRLRIKQGQKIENDIYFPVDIRSKCQKDLAIK